MKASFQFPARGGAVAPIENRSLRLSITRSARSAGPISNGILNHFKDLEAEMPFIEALAEHSVSERIVQSVEKSIVTFFTNCADGC